MILMNVTWVMWCHKPPRGQIKLPGSEWSVVFETVFQWTLTLNKRIQIIIFEAILTTILDLKEFLDYCYVWFNAINTVLLPLGISSKHSTFMAISLTAQSSIHSLDSSTVSGYYQTIIIRVSYVHSEKWWFHDRHIFRKYMFPFH